VAPIDRPKEGHTLPKVFDFFNFDFEFLKEGQNSIALHAQIYLITNGLEGA
jgi:hypothetical protein